MRPWNEIIVDVLSSATIMCQNSYFDFPSENMGDYVMVRKTDMARLQNALDDYEKTYRGETKVKVGGTI